MSILIDAAVGWGLLRGGGIRLEGGFSGVVKKSDTRFESRKASSHKPKPPKPTSEATATGGSEKEKKKGTKTDRSPSLDATKAPCQTNSERRFDPLESPRPPEAAVRAHPSAEAIPGQPQDESVFIFCCVAFGETKGNKEINSLWGSSPPYPGPQYPANSCAGSHLSKLVFVARKHPRISGI